MYTQQSFSQEGEDLLLWRLMGMDRSPGIYVDVGCNHPLRMSNTAFFYQRGWSGIAIDPNPDFAPAFRRHRRRDTFVNCGVGASDTVLPYYRFRQSLYNTFDTEKANQIAEKHSDLMETVEVQVKPLQSILLKHWPHGKSICLMSIDCEGLDFEVIQSHDFDRFPVEFLCIEQDSVNIRSAMSSELITHLESIGFVVISKAVKSMLLVHESAAPKGALAI